jgi:beta-glucanase (GH16 family)
MYGTVRGTSYGYSLWEFEVYSSGAPAPTPTTIAPTPTATGGNPQPVGQAGWNLVFGDEFEGSSLDASKWVTCYPWYNPATGCTNTGNSELQWYLPGGVSVNNGTLKLTARRQTVTGSNGVTYNYTSGMVSTGPSQGTPARFAYVYGFIEARMKLPAGKGFWPAFWTLPTEQCWPPEIDGMEAAGHQPTTISMNVHWTGAAGHQQNQSFFSGPDFTAGWHTVGVEWSATSMVWYVDGVARKTFTDPAGIPVKSEYIILNLAVDGNNPPDGTTVFPGALEVDYVRAWQH